MTVRVPGKGEDTPLLFVQPTAEGDGVGGEVKQTDLQRDEGVFKVSTKIEKRLCKSQKLLLIIISRCQGYSRAIKIMQFLPVYYYTVGKGSS